MNGEKNDNCIILDQDIGNTNSTKRCPLSDSWCFTLNNYSEFEWNCIKIVVMGDNVEKYVVGKEVGEEGTPHLQGVIKFKKRVRANEFFKNKRIHWEKCRSIEHSIVYCKKDGDYITNVYSVKEKVMKKYEGVVWKCWQSELIELIEKGEENRKIYWYWDYSGNVGKSYLCKYLVCKYDALVISGKSSDIKNACLSIEEKNKVLPSVIIYDVPRCNLDYVNYGVIEEIKNGLFYSGKYEGARS